VVNPLAGINQASYRRGVTTMLPPALVPRPPVRRPAPTNDRGGSLADRIYREQQATGHWAPQGVGTAAAGPTPQGLGWIVGKAAEGIMLPLKVMDYGRAAVASAAGELVDVALPALNEPLGKLPGVHAQTYDEDEIDRSFDLGDWWANTKARKGFKEQIVEPIMGEKGTDRPEFVKSAVGFVGDIAADPLTYGAQFGTNAIAGKAARWTYLNKLRDAQKAAELAGDAARIERLGGMQAIEKMARRGVGIANPEQAAAMGIEKNALRFMGLGVPGTERASRALSSVTGAGKGALSQAPGMAALRGIRQPVGAAGQALTPAVERLITGRGAQSAEEALRSLAADDPMRLAGGAWAGFANMGLSKLSRQTKKLGAERVNDMVMRSELGLERNIFTDYADMVREASKEVGGELPNMRPIPRIDPLTGARTESQYTIPHVLSRDFRDHLKAAYENKDPRAIDFMQSSGMRTEDLLEEGGFTQRRWFRPNDDGTPATFQIGDNELVVAEGTAEELNRKFKALFPDFEGKVYETDPVEAWRHYIQATRKDVAIRAFGEEAIGREFPGLHRDPGTPPNYDPLGGRVPMAPRPVTPGAPPQWKGGVVPKSPWDQGQLEIPMRPVSRVVRNPEELPEHEFYRYVPDINKQGQPGKLTKVRNKSLTVGEQPRILKEYREASLGGRQKIARQIDDAREKLIEPISARQGELLEDRIAAKGTAREASDTAKALEKMRNGVDEQIRTANRTISDARRDLRKLPAEAEQGIVQRQEAILREAIQARDELVAQRNTLDFQFRESQKHVQRLAAEPDAALPPGHPLSTGATREQLSAQIEQIDSQIAAAQATLKQTKNREQRKALNDTITELQRARTAAQRELDAIDAEVGFARAGAEGSRADVAQQELIRQLDTMDRADVFVHSTNLRNNAKEAARQMTALKAKLLKSASYKMRKSKDIFGEGADWFEYASEFEKKQAERALRRINPEAWAKYARQSESMQTLRRETFELERAQTDLRQKAAAMQRDLDDPDFEELTPTEHNKVQEHINDMVTRSNEMGQELHRMQGRIVQISQELRKSPIGQHADTRAAYERMMADVDTNQSVKSLEIQQRSIARRTKEWELALADNGWERQPNGSFVKWEGRRPTRKAPLRVEEAAPAPPPKQVPGQLEMRLNEPPPRPPGLPPVESPPIAGPPLPPKWRRTSPGEYERGPWKIVRSEPGVKNSGWDLIDPNGEIVDHWVKLKDVQAAMQRELPGVGVPYEAPGWMRPREIPGPPRPRPDKIADEPPWPKGPIEREIPPTPPRPEFGPTGEQLQLPGFAEGERAALTLDSEFAKELANRQARLIDLQPERLANTVAQAEHGRGVLGRSVGKKPTEPGAVVTWQRKVDDWLAKRNAERARNEKWLETNAAKVERVEQAKRFTPEAPPVAPAATRIEHPLLTEMERRRAEALKGFGTIPERSQRVLAEQMPEIAQTEQRLAAAASRVGAAPAEAKETLMSGARDYFERNRELEDLIRSEQDKVGGLQAARQEIDDAVRGTLTDYQAAMNDFMAARNEADNIAAKTEKLLSPAYAETMVRENKGTAKATKAALERVTKGTATSYEAQPMHKVIEDLRKIIKANPLGDDKLMLRIEAQLHSYEQALVRLTEETDIPAHELEKILTDVTKGKAQPVMKAQLKQAYEMLYEGGDVIISKEVKQSYLNLIEGVSDRGFPRLLRLFTNFFKTYATLSPGFHIRNGMTAIFMNLTEGVPIRAQLKAFNMWGKFAKAENPVEYLRVLAKTDPAAAEAIKATLASGAGGQFFESGVGELATGATRVKEGLFANRLTRLSQRKGQQWVEGPGRFALAYDTTLKGGSQIEALHRVTRIHFDYSQVSNFDEKAKRYIPFWTFSSRNMPLQFTQMWMKPRVYNHYQSFARNFSVEPPEFMPEYIAEAGGFDTGLRTPDWLPGAAGGMPIIANPDLPHMRLQSDVKRMTGPLTGENPSQILSDFNPAFTAPLEYITGQDFFTKQRFGEDDFSPAGPATLPLAMLLAPMGAARKGADGQWYIQDKALNSLRSLIPPLDRTARLMPQATGGKGSDRLFESWARFGLGAPGRTLSEQQMQAEALRRMYDQRDQAKMLAATGG